MQCSSTRTVCRNFHACNSRSSKEMIQIFSHQEKSNKAKHILPLKKSQIKHSPIGISQQLIQQLLSPGHQINWFFPHLGSYLDNGKETSQVSLQVGPNARTEILIQVVKIQYWFFNWSYCPLTGLWYHQIHQLQQPLGIHWQMQYNSNPYSPQIFLLLNVPFVQLWRSWWHFFTRAELLIFRYMYKFLLSNTIPKSITQLWVLLSCSIDFKRPCRKFSLWFF